MDSSNSGSFQSSSGGAGDNEEYDSTTQSISSYFNPTTNFNPNLNHLLQPQPPPPPPSSSSSYHHRPPSTNTTTFYTPSSFSLLQDPASPWTGTIRSQNNLPDFGSYNNPNNTTTTTTTTIDTQPKTAQHQIGVAIKNPKKRTRASRRAPTTVLTTDTTNFRQMVQEFTGIPTAPFTAAAPFSRRLDLFSSTRPSAHNKIQPQPPPFLNSTANIVDSGTMNNNHASAATTSANFHFAPSTIANFQKQPSTFLDLQNPMFSFQSLLQNSQSTDLTTTSSKRWTSDPNGKLEAFEGVIGNTGGSKLENVLSAAAGGSGSGDQVQGNEASWICPSN